MTSLACGLCEDARHKSCNNLEAMCAVERNFWSELSDLSASPLT